MANAQDKPKLIDTLAGALLARYIRFVRRTSWQTPEMTESFEDHYHAPSLHRRHVARPVHAAAADQAARSCPSTSCWRGTATPSCWARRCKHFDMQLIRGAGAGWPRARTAAAAHAYRAAVQALRDGRTVAMTADVPGGEARRAGLGIVMVARQSGRPILPVAIATSRYIASTPGAG